MNKWEILRQNMWDDMDDARHDSSSAFTDYDDIRHEELIRHSLPDGDHEIIQVWCSDDHLNAIDCRLLSEGYYTDNWDDDLSIVERMDICIKRALEEAAEDWIDDNKPFETRDTWGDVL